MNHVKPYSHEIIQAKTLHGKHSREVGSDATLFKTSESRIPITSMTETVEYGPHTPTLVGLAGPGRVDQKSWCSILRMKTVS